MLNIKKLSCYNTYSKCSMPHVYKAHDVILETSRNEKKVVDKYQNFSCYFSSSNHARSSGFTGLLE